MTKQHSPYDYDTNDVAAEIAREIVADPHYCDTLVESHVAGMIERKLDSMVQDGKLRTFAKRHHIVA